MNPMKCEICGGTDIVQQGEYFECQHCGVKFKIEDKQKKIVSVRLDKTEETKDNFNAGFTALENEDWRSAASFFKKVLDVNPLDAQAFHYYKYSSDLCYLYSGDKVAIKAKGLTREIANKMATIIDMYMEEQKKKENAGEKEAVASSANEEDAEEWTIDDSILEAIDDFDDLAHRIALALTQRLVEIMEKMNASLFHETESKFKNYIRSLEEAYISTRTKLEEYYQNDSEAINTINERHDGFLERWQVWFDSTSNATESEPAFTRSSYSDPPPVPPEYLETSSGSNRGLSHQSSYHSGISAGSVFKAIGRGLARFFSFLFDEDVLEVIAKAIAIISSAVFLVLTILSISHGSGILVILFQAYVAITSMVATKMLFDGFGGGESLAIVIHAFFQIALAFFVFFDFGTNLALIWRALIGVALAIFGYKILDKIRY